MTAARQSSEIQAGQVWWCDGAALAFEPLFKRRPVLVLSVDSAEGSAVVAPLSSKRRHGQEQRVEHDAGVSYLTGANCAVPDSALLRPLGVWNGYAAFCDSQAPRRALVSLMPLRRLLRIVVRKLFRR